MAWLEWHMENFVRWHQGSVVTRGGVVREGPKASVMMHEGEGKVCGIVIFVVFQASHLGCLPVVVPRVLVVVIAWLVERVRCVRHRRFYNL